MDGSIQTQRGTTLARPVFLFGLSVFCVTQVLSVLLVFFARAGNILWPHGFFAGIAIGLIFSILVSIGRFIFYDARSRGMNPALWVVISFVLTPFPIGLVLYFAMRTRSTARQS